jgi:UDP-glucose 4-epimerase
MRGLASVASSSTSQSFYDRPCIAWGVKVLITGGSGQLSSYLFEELSGDHEAWGVDVRRPSARELEKRVSLADIRDGAVMSKACREMDAVVHTAAQVSVQKSTEDPLFDADINVNGTISVLKAARSAKVGVFVYISTAATYGDPQYIPVDEKHPQSPKSFYGTSKLSGEYYTKAFHASFGLPYVVIRPFNFYSPRADAANPYSGVVTKFVMRAKRGQALVIEGSGEQTRDFIHARDVARMIRMVLESEVRNTTLNCASGQGTSVMELAETVASVSPKEVSIEHVAPRVGDIKHSVGDPSQAKKLLGFHPLITLEKGIGTFFDE